MKLLQNDRWGFNDQPLLSWKEFKIFTMIYFFFLIAISFFIIYFLIRTVILFNNKTQNQPLIVVHAPILEIIWTLIPAIVLVFVAIPSFSLLYSMDDLIDPFFTIKVIGHQWYWSYEFLDPNILFKLYVEEMREAGESVEFNTIPLAFRFDSFLLADEFLEKKSLRLLDVDNKLFLPVETNIRILVTAADVLHSWAVPAFGIKLDGCPGRLNQTGVFIKRPGIFYGQCSEICGVNHGFMPIAVVGLDLFGDGTFMTEDVADVIIPIFSILLGKLYDK